MADIVSYAARIRTGVAVRSPVENAVVRPVPIKSTAAPGPLYLLLLRRHGPFVAAMAVLGVAAGILYLVLVPREFQTNSTLYLIPRGAEIGRPGLMSAAAAVIQSYTLCDRAASDGTIAELPSVKASGLPAAVYIQSHAAAGYNDYNGLITVVAASIDPHDAAVITNKLVTTYIQHEKDRDRAAARDRITTLSSRRAELQPKFEDLLTAMEGMRKDCPALGTDPDGSRLRQRLEAINEQFAAAQANAVTMEQKYDIDHPIRQQARRMETHLSNAVAELETEARSIAESRGKYGRLTEQLADTQSSLREVERQLAATELELAEQDPVDRVRVVNAAFPEHAVRTPRIAMILPLFAAAFAALGLLVSVPRQETDDRVQSLDEFRALLGMPVVAVVPRVGTLSSRRSNATVTHIQPRSQRAEQYRAIRTSILLSGEPKRLLITSPEPGDGKSITAANIAIALAQAGRRVLLVDADLRRPSQHRHFDVPNARGLCDVVNARGQLDHAIVTTDITRLDFLPAGPAPINPSELLGGFEFDQFLIGVCARYDHVVFDSPPINLVTDATLLARRCDATVLVVRAGNTTRRAVARTRELLAAASSKVIGAVVNAAPRTREFDVYQDAYYAPVEIKPTDEPAKASGRVVNLIKLLKEAF